MTFNAGRLLCQISFVLAATIALPSQAYAGPIFFPWYVMPFIVLREIGLMILAASIIFAGIYKFRRKDAGQPMVKAVAKIFAAIFVATSLFVICRESYREWRFNNPGADPQH